MQERLRLADNRTSDPEPDKECDATQPTIHEPDEWDDEQVQLHDHTSAKRV